MNSDSFQIRPAPFFTGNFPSAIMRRMYLTPRPVILRALIDAEVNSFGEAYAVMCSRLPQRGAETRPNDNKRRLFLEEFYPLVLSEWRRWSSSFFDSEQGAQR